MIVRLKCPIYSSVPDSNIFDIPKNSDATIECTMFNRSKIYGDLSTIKIYFTIKNEKGFIVCEKKNANAGGTDQQIDMSSASSSKASILITPQDTSDLQYDQYFSFNIKVGISTKIFLTNTGKIYLQETFTK